MVKILAMCYIWMEEGYRKSWQGNFIVHSLFIKIWNGSVILFKQTPKQWTGNNPKNNKIF